MSDKYEVDGVTIHPGPGGYYELFHSSLAEPEKVRGKEHAEARAKVIAAAAQVGEGSMAPQPPIEQVTHPAPGTGGADSPPSPTNNPVDAPPPAPAPAPTKKADPEDAIATLQGLVAQQAEQIERLLARPVTTVTTEGEEASAADPLRAMPREYSGRVDAKTRAAAKKLGVEYVTIVLEESGDIPPTGLFIGHNGNSFMIVPGEEVDVPDFLLGVLDDAIMASPTVDSKSQKVLGYRSRARFPYRRISDKEAAAA